MAEDKDDSEGTLVVDEDLLTSDEELCKLLDSLSFLNSSEATSDTVKHLPPDPPTGIVAGPCGAPCRSGTRKGLPCRWSAHACPWHGPADRLVVCK